MKNFNLSWTKYAPLENESSVTDPLAFDYFAQILGNVVLPSFTYVQLIHYAVQQKLTQHRKATIFQ